MKTFTIISIFLMLAVGAGAHPQNRDAGEGDPRSVFSPRGFDILDFAAALSAQQTTTALTGKSQSYTMSLDSIQGNSREIGGQFWVNDFRVVYVYDDLLRPVEFSDYLRDSNQAAWEPFSKTVLKYNDQGYLSEVVRTLNTTGNGEMIEHIKMEVFYDSSGRVDSLVTHTASIGQVPGRVQAELFSYNDDGKPERIDVMTWDDADGLWLQASYQMITYDGEGNRLEKGDYLIGKDKEGHLYSHFEYGYDVEGRLTASVTSYFNTTTMEMEPYSKRELVYNEEGDHSQTLAYIYNNGAWEPYSLAEYTYDQVVRYADVSTVDFMYVLLFDRVSSSQPDEKMLKETALYYYVDGAFILRNRENYFVSDKTADSDEQVTSVADLQFQAPALYPNPAGDYITLEWDNAVQGHLTLEVYHITGALLMRREVVSGQQLSIDHLQTGLYLYRLTDGTELLQAGKLMKR